MFETVGIVGFANSVVLSLYLLCSKKYTDFPGMRILGLFLLLLSVKFGRLWGMPYLDEVSRELADLYRRSAISCILLLGPCAYMLWQTFKTPAVKPNYWNFLPVLPGVAVILTAPWVAFNEYRLCLVANIVLICYMAWIGVEGFIHRQGTRQYFFQLTFALASLALSAVYAFFQNARFGIAFLFGLILYSLIFYILSEALPRRQSSKKNGVGHGALKEKIYRLFDEEKVHRSEDLTLPKLSEILGESLHDVSRVINHDIGSSFSDLVNQYRIKDAKELLLKEGRGDKILSVAIDCGYNSIATFNRVFKKYTNMTPSQFRQQGNA